MVATTVVFDVFRTLVDFDGDHIEPSTWSFMASWCAYRGVALDPAALESRYRDAHDARLAAAPGEPPDVDVLEVWSDVLGVAPDERGLGSPAEAALAWRQVTTRRLAVHPGTIEMLDGLSDLRLAIVSNTQRAYTSHELTLLGLADYFDVIVFSSDVRACKPDPAPFRRAFEQLEVDAADCVYVGDNPYDDVVGAQGVGMRTVLLDRGTPVPDDVVLPRPDAVVAGVDPAGVIAAVRQLLDQR